MEHIPRTLRLKLDSATPASFLAVQEKDRSSSRRTFTTTIRVLSNEMEYFGLSAYNIYKLFSTAKVVTLIAAPSLYHSICEESMGVASGHSKVMELPSNTSTGLLLVVCNI